MDSSPEDVLSFLDLLDLDEDMIDQRLKALMVRNAHTNKSLSNALLLLQYKQLINKKEGTECENDEECRFIPKLLGQISEENIDLICKITNIVLRLNPSSLTNKCEHLLQQILSDLLGSDGVINERSENDVYPITLLKLLMCNSILEAANEKISLLFLETPLDSILLCTDEKLKNHFLMTTVPLLFEKAEGYNILDRIWLLLQKLPSDAKTVALKVLSSLSEFYLPIADNDGKLNIQSDVVLQSPFWEYVLFGMSSDDERQRKIANFLAKKAIDCVIAKKCNVKVVLDGIVLFHWNTSKEREFKLMWDDFFVLIESLEEKQSNIVLPSLQLFNNLTDLGQVWLTCAFNLGLRHDNTQVKKKVIELKILNKVHSESEAKVLLEALNDSGLIDDEAENPQTEFERLGTLYQDEMCMHYIVKAIPTVNWSPVILNIICEVTFNTSNSTKLIAEDLLNIVCDILKIPCNNGILRSHVQYHVILFLMHCWKEVVAKDFFYVWSKLHVDKILYPGLIEKIVNWLQKDVNIIHDKDDTFFNLLTKTYTDVDIIVAYLNKAKRIPDFRNEIARKLKIIQEVISRQYCNKKECFNEFLFVSSFYEHIKDEEVSEDTQISPRKIFEDLKEILDEKCGTMIQYILDLVLCDSRFGIGDMDNFMTCCKIWLNAKTTLSEVQNLKSVCIRILKENNSDLQRKVLAISILVIPVIFNNLEVDSNIEIKDILNVAENSAVNACDGDQNARGRLTNKLYETCCEMVLCLVSKNVIDIETNLNEILSFIDKATECGGYGCLKYVIKIMNCILPAANKYNLQQFIDRMWNETEELKSNNQYAACIKEFVNLITHEVLLANENYNNVILFYCAKIIEYGAVAYKPLMYLVHRIGNIVITSKSGPIIIVLHQILLFAPVPRKDQRVLEKTLRKLYHLMVFWKTSWDHEATVEIMESNISTIIQHDAVDCLFQIVDLEVFKTIITLNYKRIDEMFKNKTRYHGNSYHHKVLLLAVQHQLIIALLEPRTLELATVRWSVELMSKLPHQASVRICLEWYIALYLRFQYLAINEDILNGIGFRNIPQLSQFQILYLVLKHRIKSKSNSQGEYNFAMDYLLSHTMGQTFNVRLHAQYLAYELYKLANDESKLYDYTMKLVANNFRESSSERNYMKLKEDFFANTLDIVRCLMPRFVYILLTVLCHEKSYQGPEPVDRLPQAVQYIEIFEKDGINSQLRACWMAQFYDIDGPIDYDLYDYWTERQIMPIQNEENAETSGNIQKKYIPWRNMSNFEGFKDNKKKGNPSDMTVVASLIDKLPNLGGLARSCEVFAVRRYVVNSLRHLQDSQFQGLSVSAERWVDIEEVRPGKPLKDFLIKKKREGYSIVAAEQTSGSVPLHTFLFPKKAVLVLGHEKEGVPCDLLPLMDHCVEIEQRGFVRSLNVHVTAAIFIWEYCRQNILIEKD